MVQESQKEHGPDNRDQPAATSSWVRVGQVLRSARIDQGLTISQLAKSLHIGHKQLTAIENGDDHLLPEPVFIKAMVRRVAERLQLDANALIKQLPATGIESSGARSAPPQSSPLLNRPLLAGFAGVVGLIGITAAIISISSQQDLFIWPPTIKTQTADPGPDAVADPDAGSDPNLISSTEIASAEQGGVSPQPKGYIELSSLEPSWVSIRNQAGRIVFEGTLDKTFSYPSAQSLEIYAGRPDLVLVRDSGHPPVPLGSIENVRWHRIQSIPKPSDQKEHSDLQR